MFGGQGGPPAGYPNQGQQGQYSQQTSGYPGQQQGGSPGQQNSGYPTQQGGQYGQPPNQGQQGQYGQQNTSYPGQQQGGYPGQQNSGYPTQQGGQYGQAQGQYSQQQPGQYGQAPGQYGQQQGYSGPPMPVLVGQQYVAQYEQIFILKEKMGSLSGDDFTVVNLNNTSMSFKLDSSALSVSGARKLKDQHNHVLVNMKHKMLSGRTWFMYRGNDDSAHIADVKGPPKGTGSGPPQAQIFLKGNTSHHFSSPNPDFTIMGDVRGKAFTIRRQGQMVAEISRQLPSESSSVKFTGKDSYALKVFPGMDSAFMVALVTIVDELFYD